MNNMIMANGLVILPMIAMMFGVVIGALLIFMTTFFVVVCIEIIAKSIIFHKAKEKFWKAFIPGYNVYIESKILFGNAIYAGAYFILLSASICINFVQQFELETVIAIYKGIMILNVLLQMIYRLRLCQVFNKKLIFTIICVLSPVILLIIGVIYNNIALLVIGVLLPTVFKYIIALGSSRYIKIAKETVE